PATENVWAIDATDLAVQQFVRHMVAINAYIILFLQNMDRWMSENGKVEVEMPNGQKVTLDSIRALQAAMDGKLAKGQNGADIQNKSEFLRNIGAATQAAVNSRGVKNTALKSSRGWWECGDTGIILQWGVVTRGSDETRVDFPVKYANACFSVQLTLGNASGGSNANIVAYGVSNSGFVYYAPSIQEPWAYWFAVGY
ncbi:gp53-like domain-containing protein, partial [Xenorhabdus bovienii]|uniref:gp53-like domain-containing protein n=1 Tax=Xenorhabdus bovienii TaxID=40576 RepID=UPI003DA5CCF8